ncbi:hypothetical protein ACI4CD_28720 [Klebsiella pneumoniae]|uniref:Threonine dehydrogenase-like Zn-dependent dehydrogenase n=1 Tax=Microbacterium marinum TaxID=421115 RepID=A0A7W7FH42_9MICO|nr:hypothetical protein [Microbacterium marinum]MBB4665617.1 threonine dehydrogenase-like Zn-dependent dehydrogenase [Microbacterium marinum]MBU21250.1 hypothetical protein [Microbacterium sp.]HBS08937.1 hypothetical protein [Microbacterium sp.]
MAPAVVRHRSSRVRGRPRVDRQASDAQGIDLSPLATHEFAFDDAAAAFEQSRDASSSLKVLLRP